MLQTVDLTNEQGLSMTLSLPDISSGFVVQGIDGLDPVKATIVTSPFAGQDGSQYQTSRRENRNIIFKLGVEANYSAGSVQTLRKKLMGFFMPKSLVHMRFHRLGAPTVDIWGRVESFDFPIFAKEPQATISLISVDPDFYDPNQLSVPGNTTTSTYKMPIDYDGDVETGFEFILMPDRPLADGFIIEHQPADLTLRMLEFDAPLGAGDELLISTVSGSKGATLYTNSGSRSVLYGVSPYSDWINLFPGRNLIRVYAEGAAIPYIIRYTNKFGGL